jgi:erythromycin esterase-like protein
MVRRAHESALKGVVRPLSGQSSDYDPLLERIGDARFVLVGEASHGTHEFYRERAQITKRLIKEKGFTAVTAEADWPDAFRVNRYVRGANDDDTALDALGGFQRFPTWMWRNADVLDFIGWLRAHNDQLHARAPKVGFYGLDLYSLYTSIEALIEYLDRVDRAAADRVREHYACLDQYAGDTQAYGSAVALGVAESCQTEVVRALDLVQRRAAMFRKSDGRLDAEDHLDAQQNAVVIKNAEEYYRVMFRGRVSSWNLRDEHMARALGTIAAHLEGQGIPAKIVVWAHNSHLGDARATDFGAHGELNLGQLAKERYGKDAFSLGFTTYAGTVSAASRWDAPVERKVVRPGMRGSYEALFHGLGIDRFYLDLVQHRSVLEAYGKTFLERAIGVIYRPDTERMSHYFTASLADQFDAVLHFDQTRAVEPIDRVITWDTREVPETFPFAE